MIEKGAKLIGTDRDSDGQAGERMYVSVHLRNKFSFCSVHRIINTFGLMQSK